MPPNPPASLQEKAQAAKPLMTVKTRTIPALKYFNYTGWQFHNGRYKLIFPISITLKMSL